MIITYFRSSSFNAYGMCPQQYFLSYVLGIPSPGGKKAEKGTVVHKVLECLAHGKKAEQDGLPTFNDDVLGEQPTNRIYEDNFVNELSRLSFDYYTQKSVHDFTPRDYKDCEKWSWKAIEYSDGAYDPRKRKIVDAEPHFDITIDEPWAEYDYTMPDGVRIHGNLSIKGTVDLITDAGGGAYESTDWKTGMRKDWATGEIKDFWKLCGDPQLRIYHYALTHLYPEAKQIVPSIYFINDGGPFTMAYDDSDIEATKKMLKKRFEKIKEVVRPQLLTGYNRWKCNSFCHYGKTQHQSGKIDPKTGEPYTICQYIADKTRKCGMDTVVQEDTHEGHTIDFYQDPGI